MAARFDRYGSYTSKEVALPLDPLNRKLFPAGRFGLVDAPQPAFGYFAGGGWAFGLPERFGLRFTPEAYDAYTHPTSSVVKLTRYDERNPSRVIDSITVQTFDPNKPNYEVGWNLPPANSIVLRVHCSAITVARWPRSQRHYCRAVCF